MQTYLIIIIILYFILCRISIIYWVLILNQDIKKFYIFGKIIFYNKYNVYSNYRSNITIFDYIKYKNFIKIN